MMGLRSPENGLWFLYFYLFTWNFFVKRSTIHYSWLTDGLHSNLEKHATTLNKHRNLGCRGRILRKPQRHGTVAGPVRV
jgi:hypothetical protein